MSNLFKMEFLRHLRWVSALAVVHFLALYYIHLLGTVFIETPPVIMWMLSLTAIAGAFGFFQMALHRRANDWVYLLHRPLSPGRIHAALTLAGCCLVLLLVAVPALLMIVAMDVDGMPGIEGRHYHLLFIALAVPLTAYSAGYFAALSPSRLGVLALLLPLLIVGMLQHTAALAGIALLLLWSFVISRTVFKPDLQTAPGSIATLLLTEVPIQCGVFLLLMFGSIIYSSVLSRSGDPFQNPPAGSSLQYLQLTPREQMLLGLQASTHPDAPYLAQQVGLGEFGSVGVVDKRFSFPQRGRLPLRDVGLLLNDAERNVRWHFSHAEMLYEGRDTNSGRLTGWLGPAGFSTADGDLPQQRFETVPAVTANEFITDARHIYQVDWDALLLHLRHTNQGDDRYSTALSIAENLTTVLSDNRLYIFDSVEFRDPEIALQPRALLDLPGNDNPAARRLQVLELIDGYLVSVLTDTAPTTLNADFTLFGRAQQRLYRLRPGHGGEEVSRVALQPDFSERFVYQDMVLSPGLRLLDDLFFGLALDKPIERTLPLLYVDFPRWVAALALLSCLLSGTLTAWLLGPSALPRRIKISWCLLNGLTGLAGLLSFLGGYYWRGQDRLVITQAAAQSGD